MKDRHQLEKLLEHLEEAYLVFSSVDDANFLDFYNTAFKNFDVSAEEFFSFLNNEDELSDEGFCILGDLYFFGLGTKEDNGKALDNYKQGAEFNYPPALDSYAMLIPCAESAKLLQEAANKNFAPAAIELGRYYKYGWGVNADYEKSLELFIKAKSLGEPSADSRIKRLVKYVMDEVHYSFFTSIQKLSLLINASKIGVDISNELQRILNVIKVINRDQILCESYTILNATGIKSPDWLVTAVTHIHERELNELHKQAASVLKYVEPRNAIKSVVVRDEVIQALLSFSKENTGLRREELAMTTFT